MSILMISTKNLKTDKVESILVIHLANNPEALGIADLINRHTLATEDKHIDAFMVQSGDVVILSE